MFMKISDKTFRLMLVGMVGAAAASAAADDAEAAAQANVAQAIITTEADYEAMDHEADALVREGGRLLQRREYTDAARQYLRAVEILKKLEVNSPGVYGPKLESCRELIAKCYEYRAADLAAEADEKAHQADYNSAIAMLKEAIEIYPPAEERLLDTIEYYKRLAATDARNQEIVNLIPDAKQRRRDLELNIERGTRLLAAGDIANARRNFEAALLIDPYNVVANQRLSVINRRIAAAGQKRREADVAAQMARNEWTPVLDIVLDREAARNNILKSNVGITRVNPEATALMGKLKGIVVEKADFSGLTLDKAVRLLRKYSVQFDPSGEGVNFLIRPDEITPAASAIGMDGLPGAAGSNPFAARTGTAGTLGARAGTAGAAGTLGARTGTAGTAGARTGAAGTLGARTGAAGTRTGTAGTLGARTGAAGTRTGAAGTRAGAAGIAGNPAGLPTGLDGEGLLEPEEVKTIETLKLPSKFVIENADLGYIIDRICEAVDIQPPVIDNNAVVFAAKNVQFGDLDTVHIPINDNTLRVIGGSNAGNITRFLVRNGCEFEGDARVAYDPNTHLLSITNTPRELAKIMAIVDKKRPEIPQVMINVRFVEVRENVLKELGFNYAFSRNVRPGHEGGRFQVDSIDTSNILTSLSDQDDQIHDNIFSFGASKTQHKWQPNYNAEPGSEGPGSGTLITIGDYSFSAQVNALNQLDGKDILSAPRILTLNNTTATVSFLRNTPVPDWGEDDEDDEDSESNSSSSSTTNNSESDIVTYEWDSGQPSFNYESYGVTMSVTPNVDLATGRIELYMNPVVTALIGWDEYVTVNESAIIADLPDDKIYKPITTRREVNTQVVVRDGETIVLGGIITDETTVNQSKVPILGDIPLVGRLFRSENQDSTKMNLLIFLTCRLVGPDGAPLPLAGVPPARTAREAGVADFPMIDPID